MGPVRPHIIEGHERIRRSLALQASEGTLAHALLFSGQEAVGKRLCALELSRAILCKKLSTVGACGLCESCVVSESGNHPDLSIIESDKVGVDEVRELLYSLHLTPFLGNRRVILLNDVDKLRAHAANTLLKCLEEPRVGNFFILVTAHPLKVLSTIRSRCQLWRFGSLSSAEVKEILVRRLESPEEIEDVVATADGSLRFHELLSEEREMVRRVGELLHSFDGMGLLSFLEQLGKDKERVDRALQITTILARRRLHEERGEASARVYASLIVAAIHGQALITERNIHPLLVFQQVCFPLRPPGELLGVGLWNAPDRLASLRFS